MQHMSKALKTVYMSPWTMHYRNTKEPTQKGCIHGGDTLHGVPSSYLQIGPSSVLSLRIPIFWFIVSLCFGNFLIMFKR